MCVSVYFFLHMWVGSETWIFTHGVGSTNLCGGKILDPATSQDGQHDDAQMCSSTWLSRLVCSNMGKTHTNNNKEATKNAILPMNTEKNKHEERVKRVWSELF